MSTQHGDMPTRAAPQVWGVQALLLATADALNARFGAATVEGELSGFSRAPSGHCYFTLKDSQGAAASMRCAMFRRAASMVPFAPRDGMRVQLRGRVSVYEARGELQFVAESMALAGEGALYEKFLQLKAKLQAQGLFDDARKRALPSHVRRVGVITSLAAAALHDVATTLSRRSPHVQVVVYPTLVQGAEAPAALLAAFAAATQRAEVDVLLLVRGGGSLEDLWAFNDERVVRAVAASVIPVVVGVGHESDITLADLAGDLRAPTPTAAAEMAVPAMLDLQAELASCFKRAARAVAYRLENQASRLDRATLLASKPARVLDRHKHRLMLLESRVAPLLRASLQTAGHRLYQVQLRIGGAVATRQQGAVHRLQQLQTRLDAVHPKRILSRGYALVTDTQGTPVTQAKALAVGDAIQAVFADGKAQARVERVVRGIEFDPV